MNCSVCQNIGHSRKSHRVKCGKCGRQRFFYSLKEAEQKKIKGAYYCDVCFVELSMSADLR